MTAATLHLLTLAADDQRLSLASPVQVAPWATRTIVLADDHAAVRHGLKDLLNQERDFQIVGEAADGCQAVQLVGELQPDVLVTDLMMPELNGLEVISRVRGSQPKTRIVVVSVQADKPYVLEAFRRGANGFVQKDFSTAYLVHALRSVLAGSCYLSPPSSLAWLGEIQPDLPAGSLDVFEALTDQQRRLLGMAAAGFTDAEIAGRLLLKPVTVGRMRLALMKKFNLRSAEELARFAEQRGLTAESANAGDPPRAN